MNEPDNLTGWVDHYGTVWVRVDDCPGGTGATWWPLSPSQSGVGSPKGWGYVQGGGFEDPVPADPAVTAETIEMARLEWAKEWAR